MPVAETKNLPLLKNYICTNANIKKDSVFDLWDYVKCSLLVSSEQKCLFTYSSVH